MENLTQQQKLLVGGAAFAGVALAGTAYYLTSSSGKRSPHKGIAGSRYTKYSKEFQELPRGVVWAGGEDLVNLHIAGDSKNVDMGLKVGSMLIKVGSVQVAGKTTQEVLLTLRRIKQFPVKLQFLEQPSHCEVWSQAMDLRAKGKILYKAQKWEEALKVYNQALGLHPTLKLLYSNKILCLLQLDRANEALEMSKEMLRLDPTYSKGHYLKGQIFVKLAELMLTKPQELPVSILIRDFKFVPSVAKLVGEFLDYTAADEDHMKSIFYSHAVTEFRTTLKRQPENKQATTQLADCERLYTEVVKRMDQKVEQQIAERKRERERLLKQAQEKIQAEMLKAAQKEEEAQEAIARAEKAEAEAHALEAAAAEKAKSKSDSPPEDTKDEFSDASYVEVEKPIPGESPTAEEAAAPEEEVVVEKEPEVAPVVISDVQESAPPPVDDSSAGAAAPTDEPEAAAAAEPEKKQEQEEEVEEKQEAVAPAKVEKVPEAVVEPETPGEPEPTKEVEKVPEAVVEPETPGEPEPTKEAETPEASKPKADDETPQVEAQEEDLEQQV